MKEKLFDIMNQDTYKNYVLTKDDLKYIEQISNEIINVVNDIELGYSDDPVDDNYVDELLTSVPIYSKFNSLDEDEFEDINDARDVFNYTIGTKFQNELDKLLESEGISLRHDDKLDKYIYDRQTLAVKGYNNLLKYLNDNNIKYEVSHSTEAGYVPSIYIKDKEDNTILRIANHDNGYQEEYDMVYNSTYNKIFNNSDYANYKENIVPFVKEAIDGK